MRTAIVTLCIVIVLVFIGHAEPAYLDGGFVHPSMFRTGVALSVLLFFGGLMMLLGGEVYPNENKRDSIGDTITFGMMIVPMLVVTAFWIAGC